MQQAKTWIIALASLIVGAAVGHYSTQDRINALTGQVSALSNQLAEANEIAISTETQATDLKEQITILQSEIEEKSKLIQEQAVRINGLQATLEQGAPQPAQ